MRKSNRFSFRFFGERLSGAESGGRSAVKLNRKTSQQRDIRRGSKTTPKRRGKKRNYYRLRFQWLERCDSVAFDYRPNLFSSYAFFASSFLPAAVLLRRRPPPNLNSRREKRANAGNELDPRHPTSKYDTQESGRTRRVFVPSRIKAEFRL